ncbi:ATP-binding cassette domain-containing protein [Effusibacillus pohliae]|uniref:ATP-binding cassette domain-containing protein n=1 Tax=Effusibacillus pohliae TaxID=232270 RepID=UPI00036A7598|nr:ATP-binding cassette domain-containing protein [Effusibacillus pohliae]
MRVELSNAGFRYEKELILQHVDLQILPGSLTLVCGQTGSGKSTLLQLLAGLETPTEGRILYAARSGKLAVRVDDQRDAGGPHAAGESVVLDRRLACERIAIVFQMPETQLFAATVREDVGYGLKLRKVPQEERMRRVAAALRAVGLEPSEFLERSPFLLSGGEKRRVVLAGALVLQPEVLLLDEPTAGLDPQAQRELLEVIVRLRQTGVTLVVATHDLDLFFPLADQVVVLQKGRVAFAGSVRELAAQPDLLENAGLQPPFVARIAYRLRKKGLDLGNPLTVEELLGRLEDFTAGCVPFDSPAPSSITTPSLAARSPAAPWPATRSFPPLPVESPIHRLDPRMKWFAMIALSFACLNVTGGIGLAVSLGVVIALFWLAGVSWRKTRAFLRPFWLMFLLLLAVSAITLNHPDVPLFGPVGFSWQGAASGGLGVARFLLVILLGLLFTETTTGTPLREGFEWAIRPLRKVKVPTRDLSLAVSIALQFVPWILQKIGQLQKALAARGQAPIGWRKWTPRQISVLVVPLLISLLKMGDELATAIESRGYDRQAERTAWHPLEWNRSDSLALVVTAAIAGFIWWLG